MGGRPQNFMTTSYSVELTTLFLIGVVSQKFITEVRHENAGPSTPL
jgi:hypothetical protein